MAHTRRPSARQGLPLLTLIFIGVAPLISVAQNPSDAAADTEATAISTPANTRASDGAVGSLAPCSLACVIAP